MKEYIYIYIYITKWTIGTSFSEYWRYFFQLKTNTYLVWLLIKMKLAFFAENFRQTTYRMKKRVNGKDMVMKCSVIYCQYTFRPQLTPRCSNHNLESLLRFKQKYTQLEILLPLFLLFFFHCFACCRILRLLRKILWQLLKCFSRTWSHVNNVKSKTTKKERKKKKYNTEINLATWKTLSLNQKPYFLPFYSSSNWDKKKNLTFWKSFHVKC